MPKIRNTNMNGWKFGFFLLLSFNVAFILVVYFALQPTDQQQNLQTEISQAEFEGETVSVEITLSEQNLEAFLQSFLTGNESSSSPIIRFDGNVYLSGEWTLLGMPVQYLLVAEPFSMENGDLQLKVHEIQLGSLSLPIKQSLDLLANQYEAALPIEVDTENELVYILLTQVQTEQLNDLHLLRIDKESQEYVFEATISTQNLLQ